MRIGLNSGGVNSGDVQRIANDTTVPVSAGRTREVSGEDGDSVPEDMVTISSLAQQALQMPEVRQDRVNTLQQSVSDGEYEVDPESIAEAMLA
jgi:flagellar biosynthesis anti-sigma factor FlgM